MPLLLKKRAFYTWLKTRAKNALGVGGGKPCPHDRLLRRHARRMDDRNVLGFELGGRLPGRWGSFNRLLYDALSVLLVHVPHNRFLCDYDNWAETSLKITTQEPSLLVNAHYKL